jgi:hypothetical protein
MVGCESLDVIWRVGLEGDSRAIPQLMSPFQASLPSGFFLGKNPLGVNGFRTH